VSRDRFASLANVGELIRDVRFTPKSGYAEVQQLCPLSAISGHRVQLCVLDEGLLAIEVEQEQVVRNL